MVETKNEEIRNWALKGIELIKKYNGKLSLNEALSFLAITNLITLYFKKDEK